jgi:hypothetical protein
MWTKFSHRKNQWSNKNQKAKDETTNAQLPNNAIGVMTTLMEIKLMPLKEKKIGDELIIPSKP